MLFGVFNIRNELPYNKSILFQGEPEVNIKREQSIYKRMAESIISSSKVVLSCTMVFTAAMERNILEVLKELSSMLTPLLQNALLLE